MYQINILNHQLANGCWLQMGVEPGRKAEVIIELTHAAREVEIRWVGMKETWVWMYIQLKQQIDELYKHDVQMKEWVLN